MEPSIATQTSFISDLWSSSLPVLKSFILTQLPALFDYFLKALLIPVAYYLVDFIKSRIYTRNLSSVLETTSSLVKSAVARLNQQKLDPVRKEGKKPTKKLQEECKSEALAEVKLNLNEFSKTILNKRFPDVDSYINSLIESEVRLQKNCK